MERYVIHADELSRDEIDDLVAEYKAKGWTDVYIAERRDLRETHLTAYIVKVRK